MTWNFFKTNWFSIALVLLVLAAMSRGTGKFSLLRFFYPENPPSTISVLEPDPATTLGIGSEPSLKPAALLEVDQSTATAFLKRFASVAVSERKKFGVPASVLLAAAFLNSNAGTAEAVAEANNIFGIRCSNDWEGMTISLGDKCLRKYETPWASWRDFSIYLSSQDWLGGLRKSAGKDWQKWSKGLSGKEVSSISNFGQKMSQVIEHYRLYELDQR